MYYVWHDNMTETKANITSLVLEGYEEGISQEELAKAILMPDVPRPPVKPNKQAIVYINPQAREYIYEYEDIPAVQPNEAEVLRAEIASLKAEIESSKTEINNLQLALTEAYEEMGGGK